MIPVIVSPFTLHKQEFVDDLGVQVRRHLFHKPSLAPSVGIAFDVVPPSSFAGGDFISGLMPTSFSAAVAIGADVVSPSFAAAGAAIVPDLAPCSFTAGATGFAMTPPPFAAAGGSVVLPALLLARTMRRLLAIAAHLDPPPAACAPPVSSDANDGAHSLLHSGPNFHFLVHPGWPMVHPGWPMMEPFNLHLHLWLSWRWSA